MYIQFTIEIFSKFINYISEEFTFSIDDPPIITSTLITHILDNLLFYKNIPIIPNVENHSNITIDKFNQDLNNFLKPNLIYYSPYISPDSYNEILKRNNSLLQLLKSTKIENILSTDTSDHGFEHQYQNSITQSILRVITSVTTWLDFTMIELKDVMFIKDIIHPNNYILDENIYKTNILVIQPILENILLKHDLYITSDALDELCKLWIELNNKELKLRVLLFDQPL